MKKKILNQHVTLPSIDNNNKFQCEINILPTLIVFADLMTLEIYLIFDILETPEKIIKIGDGEGVTGVCGIVLYVIILSPKTTKNYLVGKKTIL